MENNFIPFVLYILIKKSVGYSVKRMRYTCDSAACCIGENKSLSSFSAVYAFKSFFAE